MNQQDMKELAENWHSDTNWLNAKIDEQFKAAQDHAYALGLKRGPWRAVPVGRMSMNMQALIDGMGAQWQRERAETQMTLGKLVAALEAMPAAAEVANAWDDRLTAPPPG